jgi:anti-anti-sigma factor
MTSSVTTLMSGTMPPDRPSSARPLAAIGGHLLFASTEWLSPSEVRIAVAGEVDASNAKDLATYVFGRAANCRYLTLDLSQVEFFGTAGFSALRAIESRCAQASVSWTLRPSSAVLRILRLCDPERTLPVAA